MTQKHRQIVCTSTSEDTPRLTGLSVTIFLQWLGAQVKRTKIIPISLLWQLLSKSISPKSEQMPQQEKKVCWIAWWQGFKKLCRQSDEWTNNITCWAVFHQGTYKRSVECYSSFHERPRNFLSSNIFFKRDFLFPESSPIQRNVPTFSPSVTKGSRHERKVQFFLTLFKRPLTPPPFVWTLCGEFFWRNFSKSA